MESDIWSKFERQNNILNLKKVLFGPNLNSKNLIGDIWSIFQKKISNVKNVIFGQNKNGVVLNVKIIF